MENKNIIAENYFDDAKSHVNCLEKNYSVYLEYNSKMIDTIAHILFSKGVDRMLCIEITDGQTELYLERENDEYRERKAVREKIEELRRERIARVLFETTVDSYHGAPRSYMPDSWRKDFLRRNKDHKEETKEDPTGNA